MEPFRIMTSQQLLRSDIASLQEDLAVQKAALRALASEEQGFVWEPLSDRLGILYDPSQRNGWSQVGYLGFATKRKAQDCAKALNRQGLTSKLEIRKARRLTSCKWEIKAIDISPGVLHHLANNEQAA